METVAQKELQNLRQTNSFDLNNPLLEKYLIAAKCSQAGTITADIADDGTMVYCTTASGEMTLPTPPPEAMAPSYSYQLELHNSNSPNNSAIVEYQYIKGSSLEETPASSPSGSDGSAEEAQNSIVKEDDAVLDSAASPSFPTVKSESFDSGDEDEAPKNVKMPQRKGGMQLWQFLYTLLTDPDKKYKELIEWTSNSKAREFRLLEPEAIAIWWGEHKNKRSMSYDKLSRSLRYYYDKGIIRKVSGERYVYQYCLNPELMYQHIGNSKCRPRLKPMPIAAKHATSKYQMQHAHSQYEMPMSDPVFIAGGPVALGSLSGQLPMASYLHHHPSELGYMAPPPLPLEIQHQMMAEQQMMLGIPHMAGFGHQHIEDSAEPLSMGCNSFSSFPYSTPEHNYDQLYALSTSSAPPLVETIPYDHSPSLSPATTSSESSSPTHYSNFVNPLGHSSDIDLDTFIEITYASSNGFTDSPVSYSTACDSSVLIPPPDWSYN